MMRLPKLSEAQLREQVSDWLDIGVAQGKWIYLDRPAPRPGTSREGYQQRGRGNTGFRVRGGPDIILLTRLTYEKKAIEAPLMLYDTVIQWPCSIAIELKARYGKLSDEQIEMSKQWIRYGYWITAKSLDEVKSGLEAVGITIPREET